MQNVCLQTYIQGQQNTLKIILRFLKKHNLHERITREKVGLRMQSFQVIIFTSIRTFREIFKCALVYLKDLLFGLYMETHTNTLLSSKYDHPEPLGRINLI